MQSKISIYLEACFWLLDDSGPILTFFFTISVFLVSIISQVPCSRALYSNSQLSCSFALTLYVSQFSSIFHKISLKSLFLQHPLPHAHFGRMKCQTWRKQPFNRSNDCAIKCTEQKEIRGDKNNLNKKLEVKLKSILKQLQPVKLSCLLASLHSSVPWQGKIAQCHRV